MSATGPHRHRAKTLSFVEVHSPDFDGAGALSIAWADFDKDGYLEAAVGYAHGELRLYRNIGNGQFINIGPAMGFPMQGPPILGLAWGDYDGSGFPSLYAGRAGDQLSTRNNPVTKGNLLFHNNGGKSFTEVAKDLGVDLLGASSRQVMWLDYDNSGRLSLFVAQRFGSTALFLNDGRRFTNVARDIGLFSTRRNVGACCFDFYKSGWLDIFVGSQEGDRDSFYRNMNGRFVNVARALGIDRSDRGDEDGAPGCSVVDYDNDGNFDLFIAAYGKNILYHNDGHGNLKDVAHLVGFDKREHQCVSSWADFDLDGRIDLYVSIWERGNPLARDHLYLNTPAGFVDILPDNIAARGANHSVQCVDFDNNGLMDISLASGVAPRKGANSFALYRNNLVLDGSRRALSVRVLDAKGCSTQAGAEVRVFDQDGALLGAQVYNTTGGYDSQSDMPVLFGVPGQGEVSVEVTFMSRQGRVTKRLNSIDPGAYAGRSLEIRRDPDCVDQTLAAQLVVST